MQLFTGPDTDNFVTRVRRDGATQSLPAQGLVPGDVIELSAGDRYVTVNSAFTRVTGIKLNDPITGQPDLSALTITYVPVDGRIIGASKIARDISDRKRTERALVGEYRACIEELLATLDAPRLALAVAGTHRPAASRQHADTACLWTRC